MTEEDGMTKLRINAIIREMTNLIMENTQLLDIGNKGIAHKGTMANELKKLVEQRNGHYEGFDNEINAEEFGIDKKYDIITCFEVLEHLNNPGLCLERVALHLKEDGVFVMSVPNIKSLYHIMVPQTKYHLSCWDTKTLMTRLEKHFNIVTMKHINFGRTLFGVCRQ